MPDPFGACYSRPPALEHAVLALALSVSAWTAHADEHARRADFIRHAASVLKIEARNENDTYALGTAVVVARDRVVTNCHVTRGARSITLVKGALRWPAVAQSADIEHDLCLLLVPNLESPVVDIGSAKNLKIGEVVGALGYTGGIGIAYREGTIRKLHKIDGSRVIQTTTAFTSGASGGALFDASDRLIGILTFRLPGPHGYYFSAPIDWIRPRLDDPNSYVGIGPLGPERPFWQQQKARLPFFMQAAQLEVDRQWAYMESLAERWSVAEPENPEPWIALGMSFGQQERWEDASRSLTKALQIDPASAEAWFNLGITHMRLDDMRSTAEAYHRLKPLNSSLAEELAATAGLDRH